jgi:biotin carboxyl carrier protein
MRAQEFEHDGNPHAVELRPHDAGGMSARITADGVTTEIELVATRLSAGRYLVRAGDTVREVLVERAAGQGLVIRFAEGSVALEPLDPFRDTVRRGRGGAGGARKVHAPIPGRVVDVLVALGDEVIAGQPVIVVEAMKMANELRAPIAGRITLLAVTPGLPVEAGTLLLIVESWNP